MVFETTSNEIDYTVKYTIFDGQQKYEESNTSSWHVGKIPTYSWLGPLVVSLLYWRQNKFMMDDFDLKNDTKAPTTHECILNERY